MSTSAADLAPASKTSPFRWITKLVSSSIGAKYLVAITGLLLTGFVLVHMLGNLQVLLGREALNKYAQSLKDLGPLLWLARGGLLFLFLLHIALALRLKKISLDARPVRYVHEGTLKATWVSRHMVLTGLVILAFVVFHLAHYTFGLLGQVHNPNSGEITNYLNLKDSQGRHDVYHMFIDGFRSVPMSLLYIGCQILLGLHLLHGIRSVLQTLGLNHGPINQLLNWACWGIAGGIVAGNILMPVAVMLRLIGTDVP